MTHISLQVFKTLSGLPVSDKINQCVSSVVFKYVNVTYSARPIPVLTQVTLFANFKHRFENS